MHTRDEQHYQKYIHNRVAWRACQEKGPSFNLHHCHEETIFIMNKEIDMVVFFSPTTYHWGPLVYRLQIESWDTRHFAAGTPQ